MKLPVLITASLMALCLFSCRSHRTAATVEQDSAAIHTDTTKTVADSTDRRAAAIDTTRTAAAIESATCIEFVDGGGTVSIDTAGHVTLGGVKKIAGNISGSLMQSTGISAEAIETATHFDQSAGVGSRNEQHERRESPATPARKWYDTAFVRLGQSVLIAAILWLLFLYLRRRK